jgi:hypothetical protein
MESPSKRYKTDKAYEVLISIRNEIRHASGRVKYSICGAIVFKDAEIFAEQTLRISFYMFSVIMSGFGFKMKTLSVREGGGTAYHHEILAEERNRGEDFLLLLPEFRDEKELRIQSLEKRIEISAGVLHKRGIEITMVAAEVGKTYRARLNRSLAKIKKINSLMVELNQKLMSVC